MKKEFDIIKKNKVDKNSFRVAQVINQFDLQEKSSEERFQGCFDIPDDWNIGVIVGKSGTGKTTISKKLFDETICDFEYSAPSVIDDFDKNISFSDIISALSSVGFSSPPSWIKPYSVLSNGEKMRVDLARAILTDKEVVSFDEFTSVIDREVARMGSLAVQKAIRKKNKKFIAISCHYDILDWLEPDWVFCTDDMSFKVTRGVLRRPQIKIDIRNTKGMWRYFRKYHYLNHNIHRASLEFTAFYKDKPIGFIAVKSFPHSKHRMQMIHRLVVLPDYQGIGIAQSLLNFVCSYIKKHKKSDYISIVTSLRIFARSLIKNKNFILKRQGRSSANRGLLSLNKSSSVNRNTYSFKYIGD